MAVETETGRFTVGVFQDIAWAEKGVDALRKQGLLVESLSILGKASPEMAAFIERTLGTPQSVDVHDLGPLMVRAACARTAATVASAMTFTLRATHVEPGEALNGTPAEWV